MASEDIFENKEFVKRLRKVIYHEIELFMNKTTGTKTKRNYTVNPNRTLTGWQLFTQENRSTFADQNPDSKPSEIMKLLSEEWKQLKVNDEASYLDYKERASKIPSPPKNKGKTVVDVPIEVEAETKAETEGEEPQSPPQKGGKKTKRSRKAQLLDSDDE